MSGRLGVPWPDGPPLTVAVAVAVTGVLGVALPGVAFAQTAQPHLTTRVSSQTVEVGEPFTVELKAMIDRGGAEPDSPDLRAPRGFSISPPTVSRQTFMNLGPGGGTVQVGVGASWQLVASAPGHVVLPAPTVAWNGRRLKGEPIPLDVIPATGRPRASQQQQSPFLFPGFPGFPNLPGLPSLQTQPGSPFGEPTSPDDGEEDASAVAELAMPAAPDPNVFVRAVVDKTRAVVGEQVTVSFYIYTRVDYDANELHQAPLADFLRVPLLKNPGSDPPVRAKAGGKIYQVRVTDRQALFPVHTGDLHVGVMSMRFSGRRIGAHVLRESDDVVIHVTEPPAARRPPGYALGDVGVFALTGSVEPRILEEGGAVGVTMKVTGTGNLPQSLRLPERTGVEFLDPEKREQIEPQGGVIGGFRTFGYVVRLKKTGSVPLGRVELPYWDPSGKRYQTATFDLGSVQVTPAAPSASPSGSAAATPDEPVHTDPFAGLAGPRRALSAFIPPSPPLLQLDGPRFWGALAAPPGLVGLFFAGGAALRRLRERRTARSTHADTLAAKALADAAKADARGDVKELATALERALHAAIEGASGVRSRGVLLDRLVAELEARGVPDELAGRARATLEACETIRFDPEAASTAKDLRARAKELVSELGRHATHA